MDETKRIQNKCNRLAQLADSAKGNGDQQRYRELRRQLLNEQARLYELRRATP